MSISTDREARQLQHDIIETAKASFKERPDGLTFCQHLEAAARAEIRDSSVYSYQVYAARTGWTLEIRTAAPVDATGHELFPS